MMWSFLPAANLIAFQRAETLRQMGEQARELLAEGYAVDADRVLDELNERRRTWADGQDGPVRH